MKKKLAVVLGILVLCSTQAVSDTPKEGEAEYTFARLQFNMGFTGRFGLNQEGQVPWEHDYPFSEDLFLTMLKEVTSISTSREAYKIVRLDSQEIFKYPYLYISEPGFMDLTEKELTNFREYFNRGGFAMCDDFRGRDLTNLIYQMKRVFPDLDMVRLDLSHPVFKTFYEIDSLEMVPPYGNGVPEFWGLSDKKGRLMMIANHNNDFGEYWEWVDRGEKKFEPAAQSFKFGVNYLIYAMTH